MVDWNVVITASERGFGRARKFFVQFGSVSRTEFFNVLVLRTDDPHLVMEAIVERKLENSDSLAFLSRIVPVSHTFSFQSEEEFKEKAKEISLTWVPELAGKSFHVRMHRRGFKGRLSSPEVERFLDEVLLQALENTGTPGHITFKNPDAIIAVETVGQRAGLSLWTRMDLERYPFLRLD